MIHAIIPDFRLASSESSSKPNSALQLCSFLTIVLLTWAAKPAFGQLAFSPGQKPNVTFEGFAKPFFENHCIDCHGSDSPDGNLSLEGLGKVDETNVATWRNIWAQVTLKEMPPADMDQPEIVDRLKFSDWIVSELNRVTKNEGGFKDPEDPSKGNFVDHDLLFGPLPKGIRLIPTASPARIWRVTPQEHITRLNDLINQEPKYDPKYPGKRTYGDDVPTNHDGELKLYFGTDRITNWQGGAIDYAEAVKSVPGILATARDHGFQNYPQYYTVNSAEAIRILSAGKDIVSYMAYGPLSIAQPEQITDNPNLIDQWEDSRRGQPGSILYGTEIKRPITPLIELMKGDEVPDDLLKQSVEYLFEALTFRPPSEKETQEYVNIAKSSVRKLGKEKGLILGLSAIFLDREALFRSELGSGQKPDEYGRIKLQDWELGLAVNHALCYVKPDSDLRNAILEGRMKSKEDVHREVTWILNDDSIRKPRILRFFREYFDYDQGGYICKDAKSLAATGIGLKNRAHSRSIFRATASTDRLIELVLKEDKDALKQLLTTNRVVASDIENRYFAERRTPKEALIARRRSIARGETQTEVVFAREKPINYQIKKTQISGKDVFARVSRTSFGGSSMKPERVLGTLPEQQRLGILTHPTWLVSHSDAMDNHAIRRGRWIRERLLGGGIPDVPITVDAMLPDEPNNTLRNRMRVTKQDYCWTCHKKMDPLGLPFEMYNHVGIYRKNELGKPVDTSGEIIDSGDPGLDGKVSNPLEMIRKISASQRAEQVFVRHAFRFWMGRNETIHDGPVLREAHQAYRNSGGSMKALIISLLTSDAFLYRRPDATITSDQKQEND